jgi:hypothetical protein
MRLAIVVVARHLGIMTAQAVIHRIEPQDFTDKEWVGSVQCLTEDVVASKRKVVAVAGLVAEACWDGEKFDDLYDALELNFEEMSQSDWDLWLSFWRTLQAILGCDGASI